MEPTKVRVQVGTRPERAVHAGASDGMHAYHARDHMQLLQEGTCRTRPGDAMLLSASNLESQSCGRSGCCSGLVNVHGAW